MILALHAYFSAYAACGDVDLSNFPHTIVSSYTYGVVNGSEATIVCKEGYDLVRYNQMTLRCTNRHWFRVITNGDGSEEINSSWNALCYPSQRK